MFPFKKPRRQSHPIPARSRSGSGSNSGHGRHHPSPSRFLQAAGTPSAPGAQASQLSNNGIRTLLQSQQSSQSNQSGTHTPTPTSANRQISTATLTAAPWLAQFSAPKAAMEGQEVHEEKQNAATGSYKVKSDEELKQLRAKRFKADKDAVEALRRKGLGVQARRNSAVGMGEKAGPLRFEDAVDEPTLSGEDGEGNPGTQAGDEKKSAGAQAANLGDAVRPQAARQFTSPRKPTPTLAPASAPPATRPPAPASPKHGTKTSSLTNRDPNKTTSPTTTTTPLQFPDNPFTYTGPGSIKTKVAQFLLENDKERIAIEQDGEMERLEREMMELMDGPA